MIFLMPCSWPQPAEPRDTATSSCDIVIVPRGFQDATRNRRMPQPAPPGRARPVGRGPKVRAAVLAATLTELTGSGYAALTVENVARQAAFTRRSTGVGRTGKAWSPTRSSISPRPSAFPRHRRHRHRPGTGSHGRSSRSSTARPARPSPLATLSDAPRIPGIADAKHRFFEDRFRRAQPVVAGDARGGIPPTPIRPSLSGPLSHRSTCGSWLPPSRSTRPPPTTPPR